MKITCAAALMWHKRLGFTYGWDSVAEAWVLNHTNNWFSAGFTTSPSTRGHFLGCFITDQAKKRVSDDPDEEKRYQAFRGLLAQLGFWWFKLYLYIYFDGDGLN